MSASLGLTAALSAARRLRASSVLPPTKRSRAALGLTAAAAVGRFELQTCRNCGTVQYPPRDACCRCLSVQLRWQEQSDLGELLARTTLSHSNEPFFRQRLPWSIGLIRLECGPSVVAHLHGSLTAPGVPVRVDLRLDRAGCAVLVAVPLEEVSDVAEDKQLSELSCDPKSRKVLVTDAHSEVGVALVHALSAAGASVVWAGAASASAQFEGLRNVVPLSLDVRDDASVAAAAVAIGAEVDILINTAARAAVGEANVSAAAAGDVAASAAGDSAVAATDAASFAGASSIDAARLDMEVHYFGLMRLAREFGPRMRARNAAGELGAVAWVNLLSIHALASSPALESFAAAEAAAHSLSQSLRAQMLPAGIRVVNVFAAPIDHGASALAGEIVTALQRGVEDVYPGDLAASWFARWRENPKGLERELATLAG